MSAKPGFSLIDLVCYCFLLSVLVGLLFAWVDRAQSSLKRESNGIVHVMDDHAAADLLVRDVRQSPADPAQWERMHNNEMIWRAEKSVIGWKLEQACLFRYEGKFKDGQWADYTKSLIHERVKTLSCAFVPRNSKDTHSTEHAAVTLTLNAIKVTTTLRNRRLAHG